MYNEPLHEEVSCPKKYFWQRDYLSNLAICMAFLFSIVVFFITVRWGEGWWVVVSNKQWEKWKLAIFAVSLQIFRIFFYRNVS